jgi:hypothetical protein
MRPDNVLVQQYMRQKVFAEELFVLPCDLPLTLIHTVVPRSHTTCGEATAFSLPLVLRADYNTQLLQASLITCVQRDGCIDRCVCRHAARLCTGMADTRGRATPRLSSVAPGFSYLADRPCVCRGYTYPCARLRPGSTFPYIHTHADWLSNQRCKAKKQRANIASGPPACDTLEQ